MIIHDHNETHQVGNFEGKENVRRWIDSTETPLSKVFPMFGGCQEFWNNSTKLTVLKLVGEKLIFQRC